MSPRWASWLCVAHARLGLEPQAFWSLTLLEWRMLLDGDRPAAAALSRRELDARLSAHPELKRKEREDDE